MLVGEVGLPRREFLYDIKVWEANRIIRGFKKRNRTELELLRLTAYSAFFSFRKNEQHLTPQSWLPLSFDEEETGEDKESDIPSMEEVERMREEIRRINEANGIM